MAPANGKQSRDSYFVAYLRATWKYRLAALVIVGLFAVGLLFADGVLK